MREEGRSCIWYHAPQRWRKSSKEVAQPTSWGNSPDSGLCSVNCRSQRFGHRGSICSNGLWRPFQIYLLAYLSYCDSLARLSLPSQPYSYHLERVRAEHGAYTCQTSRCKPSIWCFVLFGGYYHGADLFICQELDPAIWKDAKQRSRVSTKETSHSARSVYVSDRLCSATPRPNVLFKFGVIGLEEDLDTVERCNHRLRRAGCEATRDTGAYDILPTLLGNLTLLAWCLSRYQRFRVCRTDPRQMRLHLRWFVRLESLNSTVMAGMLPCRHCGHRLCTERDAWWKWAFKAIVLATLRFGSLFSNVVLRFTIFFRERVAAVCLRVGVLRCAEVW